MSEHSKPAQRQRVLDYIRENGSITQYEAYEHLGILRLASRMSELKKMGYPVRSKLIVVMNRFGEKNRVSRYWMEDGGEWL